MKKLLANKQINILVKLLIIALLIWAIYKQVFAKENIEDMWAAFVVRFQGANIFWLAIVVLLVPVNWGFETCKWRTLIQKFTSYSFFQVYKATLAGITVSLFTPNRVGEYGGRILLVKAKDNWNAAIATIVSSFSQMMVLLAFGLIGLLFFASFLFEISQAYLLLSVLGGTIFIALMLYCFLHIDLIIPIARKIPFPKFIKESLSRLSVLKEYTRKELSKNLLFAFLRYCTYTIQYYLILHFFGIEVSLLLALSGIATIYLLQTSIPLPPVMGLLARGQVALEVWGNFSDSQVDILGATFSLFIINLTIPALIGTIFILQTNVMKSLGYEDKNNE